MPEEEPLTAITTKFARIFIVGNRKLVLGCSVSTGFMRRPERGNRHARKTPEILRHLKEDEPDLNR
jgi:hypothetical protein